MDRVHLLNPGRSLRVGDRTLTAFRPLLWATVDSPWVHVTDTDRYLATVQPIREMEPSVILSSHLPPALGRTQECLEMLAVAPHADSFVGPDQAALEEMLAGFEPAGAPG